MILNSNKSKFHTTTWTMTASTLAMEPPIFSKNRADVCFEPQHEESAGCGFPCPVVAIPLRICVQIYNI